MKVDTLMDMIIEHDKKTVSNTIAVVEAELYEHGQYDPLSQKITIYREDLQRALYHAGVEMKGEE